MKVLPVKRLRALVDVWLECCREEGVAAGAFKMGGKYDLDKDGELGLTAGQKSLDLGPEVRATVASGWDNQGEGWFEMSFAYTKE